MEPATQGPPMGTEDTAAAEVTRPSTVAEREHVQLLLQQEQPLSAEVEEHIREAQVCSHIAAVVMGGLYGGRTVILSSAVLCALHIFLQLDI